jgi:hypothetical protein
VRGECFSNQGHIVCQPCSIDYLNNTRSSPAGALPTNAMELFREESVGLDPARSRFNQGHTFEHKCIGLFLPASVPEAFPCSGETVRAVRVLTPCQ